MKKILIAGPCAAESEAQLFATAEQLCTLARESRVELSYFRAGVWKPRSHPDTFCGVGEKALAWLQAVRERFQLPICVEVAHPEHVELCEKYGVDAYWLGARTTVNPFWVEEILKAIPDKQKPVMMKNPVTPDLACWQGSIERALNAGFTQVMAVHRGFALSNENVLRNAPIWEIPVALKLKFPEVPLICDPSHICGDKQFIPEISQIALNYGCDGLMVEVHHAPEEALSDAKQQLTPQEFITLIRSLHIGTDDASQVENLLMIERTMIEHIDNQISNLLKKRMITAENIALVKKENNIPILQPSQWNKVVERYQKEALQDPCYQKFLEEFLNILHRYSLERQQNVLNDKNRTKDE